MLTEASPSKKQTSAWERISRRRTARTAALELAVAPRLAAEAELRRASATAVQGAWPQDIEQLAHVLWPSLSKCAETVMDAIAEAKLKSLALNFSERRYGRWLRYTCISAVLEDVCSGNALWNNAKHIHDTIGETLWPPADQTRRVLARLMKELLGGPHVDSLQNRVCAALFARISHWEAAAIEKQVLSEGLHPPGLVDLPTDGAMRSEVPKLDVARIIKFMNDEGYDNKVLATALGVSIRVASSLRNNGKSHGARALTKLANLMKCDIEELYLP